MLIVGLTGNIAAGKSAVAAQLAARGATIIDADVLAREAVAPGSAGLAAIVARWGAKALAPSGELDRGALREIVFRDPAERAALDAIVHPEVERLRAAAIARARAAHARVVVCDIPLLFEVGLEASVDRIVLVDAPVDVRRARLVHDRGLATDEADAMIAAQMPADRKRARAHHLIDNGGTREALAAQVEALWHVLTAEAGPTGA
ncbi:MAG: dephospho-CoA kinase [Gemmatimonadaceae bacterium]